MVMLDHMQLLSCLTPSQAVCLNPCLSMSCVQVGPKEFVKAVLRHHSDKNPVQRCLDLAANEVLAFRADAFDASEWSGEDKGEALNMALAAVHLQCIDAGVCYAQTGLQNVLHCALQWHMCCTCVDLTDIGSLVYNA